MKKNDPLSSRIEFDRILLIQKTSIKLQFSIFIMFFAVMLVAIIGYFTLKEEKNMLTRERMTIGSLLAGNLAEGSREGILLEDELSIFELIDGIIRNDYEKDIQYIFVTGPDGQIIAHNDNRKMGVLLSDSLTRFTLRLDFPAMHRTSFNGQEILEFSHPIFEKVKNRKIGVARLGLSSASIDRVVGKAAQRIVFILLSALFAGILAAVIWVRIITRPIAQLAKGAEIIGQGDLTYRFKLSSRNEIGKLAEILNNMTRDLADAQDQLILKRQLEHEMLLARNIQSTLLPNEVPRTPILDMAAYYKAAREIGGDYYDFIRVDDTHLGVLVADVSGKSIPGAFVMGITRAILHSVAKQVRDPVETLCRVNDILQTNIRKGMFVTMLYLIIDLESREIRLASAGHDPLFYLKGGTPPYRAIRPSGLALGLRNDRLFREKIGSETLVIERGDFLALTTDGLTEAMNQQGELFGEERLFAFFAEHAGSDVETVKTKLVLALSEFTGGAEQSDDMTLVLIKVR
ncbi:MAG: hypothetical protein A2293_08815 [Elusimicrobia bacterium RIFOXYB2_FULL_49_7]|nr:MAG: hypothetical protein A2293_08815 [Elusimicrobia bacterium RIFOXYB2_FULL_49_7]